MLVFFVFAETTHFSTIYLMNLQLCLNFFRHFEIFDELVNVDGHDTEISQFLQLYRSNLFNSDLKGHFGYDKTYECENE